ncbi:MAG TPA: CBS domain-containing protein [Nitrospiraceae bacterium]|nr:CBS domain-containing protein [Nitrospiraceae bacterium]
MSKVAYMPRGTTSNGSLSMVAHMMTPGVVQIPGDVSVSEAALLMEREHIPCLLVKDSDVSFGIMTSADIVTKVVAHGLEPHEIAVRSIMSQPVHSIEYDQAVKEATSLMASTGASLLIVTKQSQPVGILTARDVMLAAKRCDTCLDATLRVGDGDGKGAKHAAVIKQLSPIGALVESSTVLLPGTGVILNFSLPGIATAFSVRGTILNSGYEPQPLADAEAASLESAIDIQFAPLPSSEEARIRAWVLQHSSRMTDLT